MCERRLTVIYAAQLCPDNVSQLFDDVSDRKKLQKAVTAVVGWRLNHAVHLDAGAITTAALRA